MVKVVFNTNVLVSSLIRKGKPRLLWSKVVDRKVRLLVSAEILSEFNQVAERPKLRKYVSSRRLRKFNQLLIQRAEVVEVRTRLPRSTEDPDDNKILEAAVDGKADYIVSGDEHLLSLREFKGVRIVNVGRMLELLGK